MHKLQTVQCKKEPTSSCVIYMRRNKILKAWNLDLCRYSDDIVTKEHA